MPLYLFYPTLANGLCDTFQGVRLHCDADVWPRALQVLDEHPSATTVVVYCEHRNVLTRSRIHPELSALLRQPARQPLGASEALTD